MNTSYNKFRQNKLEIKQEKNAEYSERTLKYYGILQEMLERGDLYGSSFDFLTSCNNYIELNEFLTDNQIAIIDKIAYHPDISDDEREGNDGAYYNDPF